MEDKLKDLNDIAQKYYESAVKDIKELGKLASENYPTLSAGLITTIISYIDSMIEFTQKYGWSE